MNKKIQNDLYYKGVENQILRIFFGILKIFRLFYLKYIIKKVPYGIEKINRNDLFLNENKFKINCIPKGKRTVFLLSFDDFSSKGVNSKDFDYGGTKGRGINKLFFRFLKKYKKVNVTFFTTASHSCVGISALSKKYNNFFKISNDRHVNFQKFITSENFLNRIEIGNHGLYHLQNDIKNFFVNHEYAFKTKKDIKDNLSAIETIFSEIGLKPYGMRPPAYGIDYDLNLIKELKKINYKYLAFSTPYNGLNDRKKLVSNIYPTKIKGIWNIPENISLSDSYESIIKKIEKIIDMKGIIHIKGHYIEGTKWLKNGIDKKNIEKLEKILNYLENKYKGKIGYYKIIDFVNKLNDGI